MRKFLALACCALGLSFGSVAGLAHVHDSADHHEEARGLHLGHGHLSSVAEHVHDGGHHHGGQHQEHRHDGHQRDGHRQTIETGAANETSADRGHEHHHHGDEIYFSAPASQSTDSSARTMPADVRTGALIDPPSAASNRDGVSSTRPRDPPHRPLPPPRGPPA